jgi:hypothetical protein
MQHEYVIFYVIKMENWRLILSLFYDSMYHKEK